MRSYKTEGIIIKRINVREADRILTIFSKYYGKIKVIARGIRKINSRRGGNLEMLNYLQLIIHKGKNLDVIGEIEPIQTFNTLKKNLTKINYCYCLCEVIDGLCPEKQENKEVFELLLESLNKIEQESDFDLNKFKIVLLAKLGFLDIKQNTPNFSVDSFIENLLSRSLKTKRILLSS